MFLLIPHVMHSCPVSNETREVRTCRQMVNLPSLAILSSTLFTSDRSKRSRSSADSDSSNKERKSMRVMRNAFELDDKVGNIATAVQLLVASKLIRGTRTVHCTVKVRAIKSAAITIGHTCNCMAIMRCCRVDFEIRSPRIT